ncbi:MAG TPA: xanthine dehydrogenase family protein subunit M [Burkholderiales bacterium]|jgi:carbon-monoxide dehydrogenase medium subunit|nr:xanthine dehydrogenase family protein subunit M [Burkholderiales bacterium]
MKPPRFAYHDPQSLSEALALLGRLDNARLLAGGQSLMPMLNMRLATPDHIIDLNGIADLAFIKVEPEALAVGAMTRQRDVEFDARIRSRCPLMHEAVLQVGHRQTRNRGTLGGSLCHLDPSAELITVAAAMDAVVTAQSKNGSRDVPFAEFPAGLMTPALRPGELVTAVRFPLWREGHGHAFVEFSRRHGDFAIVSAAALLEEAGGKITRASLTLGGIAPAPVRVAEVERMLTGSVPAIELFREAGEACRKLEVMEDVHVTAAYRRQLAAVLSRRALEKAHERVARH